MFFSFFFQIANSDPTTGASKHLWTFFDVIRDSFDNLLRTTTDRLPFIAAGIVVLVLFWFFGKFVKRIFWSATAKTRLDSRLRILISRLLFVFTAVLGLFTALTVVIPSFGFRDLIAGLGFTSFVIGFATKDILNNLLSGVLILWQQPFRIGDYLFVGSNQGKVEYIGVRATQLRKDDGELVLIPNGDMYSSAITIRGAGAERRMVLKLALGYETDLTAAKHLIHDALCASEGVIESPEPNVVVTELTGDGVNISAYFWLNTDTHSPLTVFDTVATTVKTELEAHDFELFPPGSMIVHSADNGAVTPGRKRDPLD